MGRLASSMDVRGTASDWWAVEGDVVVPDDRDSVFGVDRLELV